MSIENNISILKSRIEKFCALNHRNPKDIRVIAVSKSQSPEQIKELYQLGFRVFGENYAQELSQKASVLTPLDITWVFIGALQSNKIPSLVPMVSEIQTVTSEKHARLIAKNALEHHKTPFSIYLSVNMDEEPSKNGLKPSDILTLSKIIEQKYPELALQGIMAIPAPLTEQELQNGIIPPSYQKLKELAKQVGAGKLSLGMSHDLEVAIAAGTDELRIGTALFGERPTPA